MMAMNVIERLLAMLLHIGLTVIVYYGVINAKKAYLAMAILLHMLMDIFPALYQRGAVSLWAVEVWAASWTALVIVISVKLFGKMEISSSMILLSLPSILKIGKDLLRRESISCRMVS
jgi:uncharacterized membrane protein YhfC